VSRGSPGAGAPLGLDTAGGPPSAGPTSPPIPRRAAAEGAIGDVSARGGVQPALPVHKKIKVPCNDHRQEGGDEQPQTALGGVGTDDRIGDAGRCHDSERDRQRKNDPGGALEQAATTNARSRNAQEPPGPGAQGEPGAESVLMPLPVQLARDGQREGPDDHALARCETCPAFRADRRRKTTKIVRAVRADLPERPHYAARERVLFVRREREDRRNGKRQEDNRRLAWTIRPFRDVAKLPARRQSRRVDGQQQQRQAHKGTYRLSRSLSCISRSAESTLVQ